MNRETIETWIGYPNREYRLCIDRSARGYTLVVVIGKHETTIATGTREEMQREAARQTVQIG